MHFSVLHVNYICLDGRGMTPNNRILRARTCNHGVNYVKWRHFKSLRVSICFINYYSSLIFSANYFIFKVVDLYFIYSVLLWAKTRSNHKQSIHIKLKHLCLKFYFLKKVHVGHTAVCTSNILSIVNLWKNHTLVKNHI